MTEENNAAVAAQDNQSETPTEQAQAHEAPQSFLESITDEELKGSKSLADFKDINGLAKSYVNLEKKLGAPREPESFKAEEYTYNLPENYEANDDIMGVVKEKAVELGISPKNFGALIETFATKENEILASMQEEQQQSQKQFQDSLKEEWGASYEDKLKAADDTWRLVAPQEADSMLSQLPAEQQVVIAKVMDNIASKISEESIGKQNNNFNLTKDEASNKLAKIYEDSNHPYFKGDQAAVAEVFKLQKATL